MGVVEYRDDVYLSASIDAPGTPMLWELGELDSKGACTAPHDLGPPMACMRDLSRPPGVQRWSREEQPVGVAHSENLTGRPSWEVKKRSGGAATTGERSDASGAEIAVVCRPWKKAALTVEILLSERYAELSPGSTLDVVVDSVQMPGTIVARLKARFVDDEQRRHLELERPDELMALLSAGQPVSMHLASGPKTKTMRWLGEWALRGAPEAVDQVRSACQHAPR